MRTQKFLSVPVLLFAAASLFSSCKKDDAPSQSCRIITISASGSDPINFTYNADGKVSSYISGKTSITYAYSGNNVVSNETYNGAFSQKKIITNGANGLTTNVKTETSANGSTWFNDSYEYNGTQLIKATTTFSDGSQPTVNIIKWENGNMSTLTNGNNITNIEYYTDKPAQQGDYLDLIQKIQNVNIYRTKNAIKSLFSGGDINTYEYTFGSEGITGLKMSQGNSTTNYTYQHQCN